MLTKTEVIEVFKTRRNIAESLGITRQAINEWPEVLSEPLSLRIIDAAIDCALTVPDTWVNGTWTQHASDYLNRLVQVYGIRAVNQMIHQAQ